MLFIWLPILPPIATESRPNIKLIIPTRIMFAPDIPAAKPPQSESTDRAKESTIDSFAERILEQSLSAFVSSR